MKPINGFENVEAAREGYETLPAGGYVCRIEKCVLKPNKSGNGEHLEILFDIAEGDYRGWFTSDWKNQNREDKFWRGIIRQNIPNENAAKYENQLRFFKRFISDIEKSNEGYHWDWDEAGLKNKLIGVIFGEVERMSSRGTQYMATQADSITSVENIHDGKFKIPAPKMLVQSQTAPTFAEPVDESDLPF